ncbi:MAG: glycosyl hydrolase family 28 protein [Bacteroidota bacterium]
MKILSSVLLIFHLSFACAQVFNITDFGAIGNGSSMNTSAIQAAVDSCHNAGGGIVEVPAGNFLTATIFLKSNVTIHLAQGATITGSGNTNDYPDVIPLIRSYTDKYTQRSVFYAEGQHNIGITGEGTFQGNGISVSFFTDSDNKPYGFRFISCSNVRYEGITMRNSGFWMMHNKDIDTLVIKNLTIVNQNLGNGDGINIDGCKNVVVDSCWADCNDDPIVIKTTSLSSCENVSISNCTVASYSRAIKIGTETHGAFKNIHIRDITVQVSPTAAIHAKCGINLSVVDGGSMENVLIENVTMTGIKVPLLIRLGNRARKYTDTASTPGVGFLRNIELRNITAISSTNVTSSITGIPGYYAKAIRLSDIDITFPGGQAAVYPGFVVPENVNAGPEATIFGDTLPASGLYIRHVDSVQLNNVCVHGQQPDGRPAFVFDDVLNSGSAVTVDSLQNCFSTGVDKIIGDEDLRIFPNPFASIFTIEVPNNALKSDVHLKMLDVTGRNVWKQKIVSDNTILDLPYIDKGIYFVNIEGEGVSISKRIVKVY